MGRWGKALVEGAHTGQRLRFVRGVDSDPENVAAFAATHRFSVSERFEDVLSDPGIQAIMLATPHSVHVEQVIAVARAGKAVWCEKPLALTRSEAERALAACREAGVPFALGNNKRCFASMRALKEVVASGSLGEILHIEGHFCNEHSTHVSGGWRDDPREAPGGGFTGAGLHLIDAFVNLAGPITRADARLFVQKPAPDPRDAAAALIDFASGATGMLATVRAGAAYWRVHVFGTRGWAEARDENVITLAPLGEPPGRQVLTRADSLAVLLDAFVDTIESGTPFPVSQEQMLYVVSAFEAIIRSLAEGQPALVSNG